MAKYLFAYHGGNHPETEEEVAQVMEAWNQWLQGLGDKLIDGGNPVGLSSTVYSDHTVSDNGGSNPVSGYSFVQADSDDDAQEMAKGCPILDAGGSVEVAEVIDLM